MSIVKFWITAAPPVIGAPFSMVAGTQASVTVLTSDATDFTVDWGDGTVETFSNGTTTPTHTYAPAYTGDVEISTVGAATIVRLEHRGYGLNANWNFPVTAIPSTVARFVVQSPNVISGPVADFSALATYIDIGGQNVIDGLIDDMGTNVTVFNVTGSNTIAGSVDNITATGLQTFILGGNNTATGTLLGLPRSILFLSLLGQNTVVGDSADLPPNLRSIHITGNGSMNGTTADFSGMTLLTQLRHENASIGGDVALLPNSIVTLELLGSPAVFGAMSGLPTSATSITVRGTANLSGVVSDLSNALAIFVYSGTPAAKITMGGAWPTALRILELNYTGPGMTDAEVNALLAAALAGGPGSGTRRITIDGPHAAPTGQGLTDAAALNAAGWTVTHN